MAQKDPSKRNWPGFIHSVRRFFFGETQPPKAKRLGETSTPTTSSYHEGMHKYYRWFRQDSYTRKCILTNAYFATMTASFETALQQTGYADIENYTYVKEGVDEYRDGVPVEVELR